MSSDPIKIAPEADVILAVKLPVRCSVLGLLCTSLSEQYGLGLHFRQTGEYLEFFTEPGYQLPDRDTHEKDEEQFYEDYEA